MTICKKCGKEFEGDGIYCTPCRWEMKWPSEILNAPGLASRRKRSHNLKILSLDKINAVAEFQASLSKARTYQTTLGHCTCNDFALAHGEWPCKHIFRLAEELRLLKNEKFEIEENDYTVDDRKYFSPKLNIELGRLLEAIAERENVTSSEQVHLFLEEAVCDYLENNNLLFMETENNKYELIKKNKE